MEPLNFLKDLMDLNQTDLDLDQRRMVGQYIQFLEKKLRVI